MTYIKLDIKQLKAQYERDQYLYARNWCKSVEDVLDLGYSILAVKENENFWWINQFQQTYMVTKELNPHLNLRQNCRLVLNKKRAEKVIIHPLRIEDG